MPNTRQFGIRRFANRRFISRGFGSGVASGVPTQLSFSTQPSGAAAGTTMTQQPVVRALDALGNLATSFTGNVTLSKVNGTGTLSGTATVAAVGGVATFSGLSLTTTGHYVLEATASGLTAKRSGMMSCTTSTGTGYTMSSRNFGGGTTSDVGDCGSGSTIDNLGAGTMTVMVRIKRNSTGTNQFQISKYAAANTGWALNIDDSSGVGDLQVNFGRATSDALVASDDASPVVVGTWYDLAFTWNIADGTPIRIFQSTINAVMAEVTAYDGTSTWGSGAADTDAGANLYIGNLQIAPTNPAQSDIAWAAVFSTVLTAAQMNIVKNGFTSNNVTMITNLGNCKMLQRVDGTGSLTDLSGNGNTCVISGTTAGGTQSFNVPTIWANSIDATDSTNYLFTNNAAAVYFSTSATSVDVWGYRTLEAAYDAQAAITVLENGVYKGQFLAPFVGAFVGTISLSAGAKTVALVNGVRSRPVGTAEGTFLVGARFNAAATDVIPTTPSSNIVFLADSLLGDFLASPVGQFGAVSQFREYLRSSQSVMIEGYGGASLFDYASDATARANTVTKIARYNPSTLNIDLAANDYQGSVWTAATFQTAMAALLVALNAEMPLMNIVLFTMPARPAGEGANGLGDNAAAYRTASTNAASGKSYVTLRNGVTQLWDGSNTDDASHPNNTGSAQVLANLKTANNV